MYLPNINRALFNTFSNVKDTYPNANSIEVSSSNETNANLVICTYSSQNTFRLKLPTGLLSDVSLQVLNDIEIQNKFEKLHLTMKPFQNLHDSKTQINSFLVGIRCIPEEFEVLSMLEANLDLLPLISKVCLSSIDYFKVNAMHLKFVRYQEDNNNIEWLRLYFNVHSNSLEEAMENESKFESEVVFPLLDRIDGRLVIHVVPV